MTVVCDWKIVSGSLANAGCEVLEINQHQKVDMRNAAYMLAIKRIADEARKSNKTWNR